MKVAQTETTGALNGGNFAAQQALEDEGLSNGREWVSIIDHVTRPDHVDMNETQVGVGQQFNVAGTMCDYPGDPVLPAEQRVNCRCACISIIEPLEASHPVNRIKAHLLNGHNSH